MQIEQNIPLPEIKSGPNSPRTRVKWKEEIYPFYKMNIGDSILIQEVINHSIRCKISRESKRCGMKLVSRSVENGTRVWRIA